MRVTNRLNCTILFLLVVRLNFEINKKLRIPERFKKKIVILVVQGKDIEAACIDCSYHITVINHNDIHPYE